MLLLIEDDLELGSLIIEYLTSFQYTVQHVTTGQAGLQALRQPRRVNMYEFPTIALSIVRELGE